MLNIFIHLHMIPSVCPLIFTWPFWCFTSFKIPCLRDKLEKCFWNSCDKLYQLPVLICALPFFVPNLWLSNSFTVVLKWNMYLFYVVLRSSTTSLPLPGALILCYIGILKSSDKIDNNYNDVAHSYISDQTYVFSRIVLRL